MKFKAFFCLMISNIASLYAQTINDDRVFFNYDYNREFIVMNNIEQITIDMFIKDSLFAKHTYYFDKAGILKSGKFYNELNTTIKEYVFKTNDNGNLIERIETDHLTSSINSTYFYYTYLDKKVVKDSTPSLNTVNTYKFNKSGRIIEKLMTSQWGSEKIIYELDKMGKPLEIIERRYMSLSDTIGYIFSHKVLKYDTNGKLILEDEKVKVNSGFLGNEGVVSYGYDDKGNIVSIRKEKAAYFIENNFKGLPETIVTSLNIAGVNTQLTDKFQYVYFTQ